MKRAQRLVQLLVLPTLVALSLAQEQSITRKGVPPAVLAAFAKAYPKATIKGYSKETEKAQTVYEIESVEGKTTRDVTYSADGKLISVEETLDTSEVPPGVKAALEKKFPGGKILKAEKVTKGTLVGYELQVKHKGKRIEIIFDAAGRRIEEEEDVD